MKEYVVQNKKYYQNDKIDKYRCECIANINYTY